MKKKEKCRLCEEIIYMLKAYKFLIKLNKEQIEWTCSKCKSKHDRDVNASINIRNMAFTNQNLIRCIGLEQSESKPLELLDY